MEELARLGERLSAGRTADIYRWSETEIVKFYQPWVSRVAVERERSNMLAARGMRLPVPSAGEIVALAGRMGLLMERIPGDTMMRRIERDISRTGSFARQLAELHASLNSLAADTKLPSQRAILRDKIAGCGRLASPEREAALASLSRMPGGDRLCHGDFHPGNIIIDGERCFIIDWPDACNGNPTADLARSSILFLGHIATSPASAEERGAMELFHQAYLGAYMRRMAVNRDEYGMWLSIQAAARLGEGIAEIEEWLLAQVRAEFSFTGP